MAETSIVRQKSENSLQPWPLNTFLKSLWHQSITSCHINRVLFANIGHSRHQTRTSSRICSRIWDLQIKQLHRNIHTCTHIWVQNAKMSVMKTLISSLGNSTEIHDYQSCQLPHSVEAKIHHIKRRFSKIVVSVCSGSRYLSPEVLKYNIQILALWIRLYSFMMHYTFSELMVSLIHKLIQRFSNLNILQQLYAELHCLFFRAGWQQQDSRPFIPSPDYALPQHNVISLI